MTLESDVLSQCTTAYTNVDNERSRVIIKSHDKEYDGQPVIFTPIQKFYENQTIFITGGTGFLGKALIEKLSRCCLGISRIYVLVRKKKDKDPNERLQESIQDPLFDVVRARVPNFERKITAMAGDCSLENLGLCEDDAVVLKREVSIVFHCAATVRFDEKLKKAAAVNIQSTVTITDLCKDMHNLKAFIYVSTAYAHCFNNSTTEETFYDYSVNYKDVLFVVNSMSEKTVKEITPVLVKSWLNSYTTTKALAENCLKTASGNLPVAIFRPAIVTPSAYEPMPGWTDNYNGATGIIAGITSGLMRVLHCDPDKNADLTPVDFTVNALIASAWDVTLQVMKRNEKMLIYNYTSGNEAPISWGIVASLVLKYNERYPLNSALWYAIFRVTKYKFMYNFYKFFLHLVPAFIVDLATRSIGQRPRMMKTYEKIHKLSDLMNYIGLNEWKVKTDNMQSLWSKLDCEDRAIFRFSMQNFDWEYYFSNYIKGIRMFLFKDDLRTLGESRLKYEKLSFMHQMLRVALAAIAYYTLQKVSRNRNYDPRRSNYNLHAKV